MSAGDGFIQGMDVSKWQTTTPSLKDVDFLIARAGIGTKPDATFGMHLSNGKAAGLNIFGSYWYNIGSLTPAQEVAAYIAVEKTSPVPLDIHVIDWEGTDGFTAAQAAEFIAKYRAASGHKIWLYASEGRFRDLGQDFNWIANYSQEPIKHYNIWQYGPLNGADGNYFRGTLADLKTLLGRTEETMDINAIKAEDWTPTTNATTGASNGVFRSAPEHSAPIIDRVPLGTKVRSVAEVTGPAGDNWRMTERNGVPAYMLRSDWTPAVQGGDPTVDALLTNVINRVPLLTQAQADALVAAQKTADQAAVDKANAALATAQSQLATAAQTERERLAKVMGDRAADEIRTA